MKTLLLALYILLSIFSEAQNIEISGGTNYNRFYDFQSNEDHFNASYTGKHGFTVGVGISEVYIASKPMRFTIQYDHFGGYFYCRNGGLGGGYSTTANVIRNDLTIAIFPLNFTFWHNLKLDFGFTVSYRISDETLGEKSFWSLFQPSTLTMIENDSIKINRDFTYGISGSFWYPFDITYNLQVAPRYTFHLGISDIFMNTEANIKSSRHLGEIVLIYKLQ